MDKKSTCQTWVGNIYQTIEAVFHEVDDLVNKDSVKYVENQVQTVGRSMKKFYSDVVQDILPTSVNPVKHVAKIVPSGQIDMLGSHASSTVGTNEDANDVDAKNSSVKEDPSVPTESASPQISDPCHQKKICFLAGEITVEEAETKLPSLQQGDEQMNTISAKSVQAHENSDKSSDDDVAEEECPYEDVSSSEYRNSPKMSSSEEKCNDDCHVTSHEPSKNHLASAPIEGQGLLRSSGYDDALFENADWGIDDILEFNLNNDNTQKRIVDGFGYDSDTSSTLQSFEPECSIIHCENKEEEFHSSSSNLNEKEENKEEEVRHISSSNFQQTKIYDDDLSRSSTANLLIKSETVYFNPTDAMSCFSETSHSLSSSECFSKTSHSVSSSESFPAIVSDENDAAICPAFYRSTFLPIADGDTTRIGEVISVNGTSTVSNHQYCKLAQPEASMAYLVIKDGLDIGVQDEDMETIDLSDKNKFDESCVIVEDPQANAFLRRSGRNRSYKKMIQDALDSRKRLPKEYKQLAIWYGDIDKEMSVMEENKLQNIRSSSIELKKAATQDPCDSEWELV